MATKNYGAVADLDELREHLDRIGDQVWALDIETGFDGPDREKAAIHPETAKLVGISFTTSLDWARYVPLAHDEGENLDNLEAARLFWPVLRRGNMVAHNAGFELRHLAKWFRIHLWDDPEFGEQVRQSNGYFPIRSDTMVEAYLAAEFQRFGLKVLTKELFGHQMTELFELFPDMPKNKRKFLRFNTLALEPRVIEYACEDSVWCLAIHQRYYPKVSGRLLYTVEKAIVQNVVPGMEDEGLVYDWATMRRTADTLSTFRDKFNAEIMTTLSELAGRPIAINLASPPQIGDVLYNQLGYATTVYTDKTRDLPPGERKMSTGKIALERLAQQYPVVQKIREWKQITRLLGTYLDQYETKFNYADDGRAHPNHLSAFVITGRFAVSDPPYQQCLPGSYEVLTPTGWQRLDELDDLTSVAQYDANGDLEFVLPEQVVRTPYDGDMIELRGGEIGTWRYTPNHRLVYRTRDRRNGGFSEIKVADAESWEHSLITSGRLDRLHVTAGWRKGGIRLNDAERLELRLAIAVQADGTRTNGRQYDIAVHLDRKVNALRELGLEPEQQSRGRWRTRIPRARLDRWLDENKDFRSEAILELSQPDLDVFLNDIMEWDGDSTRYATYGQKVCRRTSVEVVQAAAALNGYTTSLYERPEHDAVTVNVHDNVLKGSGWQEPVRVPSEGMVYCVTVPTGMFLCRNDQGKVMVTGNSPKKYHYDLAEAKAAHEAGVTPPPGTCFQFNFRDCVIAPPDHYILGFDLSQAELRAIAGEAQEPALLEAFANGEDVHKKTASLMLGVPIDEITKDQRDIGKAQPLDAGIMTPTGIRRMGDLAVGDFVIGSDGMPTKITGVFPQGMKEVFRVTTSDGASTECCEEHLWTVQNVNSRNAPWRTRPLKDLVASGLLQGRGPRAKYPQPKYKLPDRQPVQFEPGPELPIDPYVLGALLGDGGFTHGWAPMFCSADQELLDAVRTEHERLGGRWASEVETHPGFHRAYLSGGERFVRGTNVIKDSLRDLGLWGHRDHLKFVPDVYLHATPADRLALLQGLLDTDGNVLASGAQFRVTSRRLAEAVQFLARSLGGWASLKALSKQKTPFHVKSEPRDMWVVYLRLPKGVCPFRLSRKIKSWKETIYKAPQTIMSVEPVGVKETQCISVSAGDGLYLTDEFIYSHNTMNFALGYGMGVKSLADRLGIPIEEAQALMDKYFAGLPNIVTWSQRQIEHGKKHGYVVSKFGRMLPIWEYQSGQRWIYQKGDRACVNYPIQGAATGDYMKIAMVQAVAAIKQAVLADKIKLVMNIHDALEFYVHKSIEPQEAIAVLEDAVIFAVPGWPSMKADWHIARKWGSPTEIDVLDDGSVVAKGAKVQDIVPAIEEDEDGDAVEVMPEVDPVVLREAALGGSGRLVVMTLPEMPTQESWARFIALNDGLPGTNEIKVLTPRGEVNLPYTTALNPRHLGEVNQIFPGASLAYAADAVDRITDGLLL